MIIFWKTLGTIEPSKTLGTIGTNGGQGKPQEPQEPKGAKEPGPWGPFQRNPGAWLLGPLGVPQGLLLEPLLGPPGLSWGPRVSLVACLYQCFVKSVLGRKSGFAIH